MTPSMRSSEGLDERRRRILYRCWHRGTREMDMVFGPYANDHLEAMSETELDTFEDLIAHQDTDLAKWFLGQVAVPVEVDSPMFRAVRAHAEAAARAMQS